MKRVVYCAWILCMAMAVCGCGDGYEVLISSSAASVSEEDQLPETAGSSSGEESASGDGKSQAADGISGKDKSQSADGANNGQDGAGSAGDTGHVSPSRYPAEPLIYVYVCGAVNQPGVYALAEGSRVIDALAAAGGAAPKAELKALNQAQLLSDGEQITVLTEQEVAEGKGSSAVTGGASSANAGGNKASAETEKVNLNTASKEELMTLPGIGEARAEAILAYREENGAFQSAEELMKIEGIKEKSYAKLADRICV